MIGTYAATALRYVALAACIGSAMVLFHRLLRRCGVSDRSALGWTFTLPWTLGMLIFWIGPVVASALLSFTEYQVLSSPTWVGLRNYATIVLDDPAFRTAAYNTVTFAACSVGLGIAASLGAALLLSLDLRTMGVWRAIYYVPSVIPAVSTALLWRYIFVPGGLANTVLAAIGLPAPGWFQDPSWVIPAFVIMSLQGAAGNNMVIFLAKLRGIDATLYEAASLDGAGVWARFRHITIPQLSPVIFYHLVMGIIGGLQLFTQPMFIRTPGRSGLFYAPYIYRKGLAEWRMGYACALSWILLAGILVLTAIVFRWSRGWVHYEAAEPTTGATSHAVRPRGWRLALWYLAVTGIGLVMLVPLAWMVSASLKPADDVLAMPPTVLPHPPQPGNYVEAWQALPFSRYLANTVFIAALAVGGQVLSAALVAYGFARFRFRGKRVLFGFMIATLMVPGVVTMIPVFLIWKHLGLVGQFDPLVLGSLFGGGALFVFIAHQFFRTLPPELEEAAALDGAGPARVFFQIIAPLAKPVLLVIALIAFQAAWNDFLGPLLYLNRSEFYTMTVGLHFFQGLFMGEAPKYHWMMAITTLMAVPTVVLFLITQMAFFRQASRPRS